VAARCSATEVGICAALLLVQAPLSCDVNEVNLLPALLSSLQLSMHLCQAQHQRHKGKSFAIMHYEQSPSLVPL
jgi:hypothetical protein